MESKDRLSVVIDGRVYVISGGSSDHIQKIATYVDNKISELKRQGGYSKLSPEYRSVLLSLNIPHLSASNLQRTAGNRG